MTDRSLPARLRDVLSDELLTPWAGGYVADLRDEMVHALLPLLVSLQEEQMREVRMKLEAIGVCLRSGWNMLDEMDRNGNLLAGIDATGDLLARLSPTWAAEGQKE